MYISEYIGSIHMHTPIHMQSKREDYHVHLHIHCVHIVCMCGHHWCVPMCEAHTTQHVHSSNVSVHTMETLVRVCVSISSVVGARVLAVWRGRARVYAQSVDW